MSSFRYEEKSCFKQARCPFLRSTLFFVHQSDCWHTIILTPKWKCSVDKFYSWHIASSVAYSYIKHHIIIYVENCYDTFQRFTPKSRVQPAPCYAPQFSIASRRFAYVRLELIWILSYRLSQFPERCQFEYTVLYIEHRCINNLFGIYKNLLENIIWRKCPWNWQTSNKLPL